MNIGISTFPTDYSTDIALLARWAEEMGFESLWVPEHPIIPVQTSSPWPGSADGALPKAYADIVDPFVALARIHRFIQVDGVRTAEGCEGVTGAIIRA